MYRRIYKRSCRKPALRVAMARLHSRTCLHKLIKCATKQNQIVFFRANVNDKFNLIGPRLRCSKITLLTMFYSYVDCFNVL